MISFSQLRENLEEDVISILKRIGVSELEINYDEGYVAGEFDTKSKVESAVDQLPENLDYEIEVMVEVEGGEDMEIDKTDDIEEIDFDQLDDSTHIYEIYVYLDNTSFDEGCCPGGELTEARKRVIKVNSKGKRRIKIKCGKGFKFDGKKCVKIGGTEAIKKRKAIKKAVRTKKAKGAGATRKASRLRARALKKRKGMGL